MRRISRRYLLDILIGSLLFVHSARFFTQRKKLIRSYEIMMTI
jgi:hypothetical protein